MSSHTATLTQATEGGVATLHLRGEAAAATAVPVLQFDPITGLRTDREYPEQYTGPNPENWPSGRTGMPDYRPLNRDRDAVSRPLGATTDQRIFVSMMMAGVFVLGQVNQTWRRSVGRITDGVWSYPVGGTF